MTSECFMLENVYTTTRTFCFGTTDLDYTICLDRSRNKQGIPDGDLYIAESLRDEDCCARSGDIYAVKYIFSKVTHAREYDTLHFRETSASIQDLPQTVIDMLSQDLVRDLIHADLPDDN